MHITQPRRPFPLGYSIRLLRGDDALSHRYQRRIVGALLAIPAAILLLHIAPQVLFGWPSALVMIFGDM